MIRVVLADDHRLVRRGLKLLLESVDDIEVVGEAADGVQAIELASTVRPHVVLMDIAMAGLDGFQATCEIVARHPEVKVLVLTMYRETPRVAQMLAAGASGYLVKSAAPEDLVAAVRAVARGRRYLQAEVGGAVIDDVLKGELHRTAPLLSRREQQVVQLLAIGLPVGEIARDLAISQRTVQTHRQNAMGKLGLHNSRELVLYALAEGLISPPAP